MLNFIFFAQAPCGERIKVRGRLEN